MDSPGPATPRSKYEPGLPLPATPGSFGPGAEAEEEGEGGSTGEGWCGNQGTDLHPSQPPVSRGDSPGTCLETAVHFSSADALTPHHPLLPGSVARGCPKARQGHTRVWAIALPQAQHTRVRALSSAPAHLIVGRAMGEQGG